MNQVSLRASPGGSTAFSRNCSSRCVLVNVPSFSAVPAAGKRNTSVAIFSDTVRRALHFRRIAYQNEAVSVSTMSRTTSHFSFDESIAFADAHSEAPTAGILPHHKQAFHLPVLHV